MRVGHGAAPACKAHPCQLLHHRCIAQRRRKLVGYFLTMFSHPNISLSPIHSVWKSPILNKFLLKSKQFQHCLKIAVETSYWNVFLTFSHAWKLGIQNRANVALQVLFSDAEKQVHPNLMYQKFQNDLFYYGFEFSFKLENVGNHL